MTKITIDKLTELAIALLPRNFTIKFKLTLMAGLVLIGMGGMMVIDHFTSTEFNELQNGRIILHDLEADLLTLRRNEKDFLARSDLKYQQKFNTQYQSLLEELTELQQSLRTRGLPTDKLGQLSELTRDYATKFNAIVAEQQTIGLNKKDGLYGRLRESVHSAETSIKELNDNRLLADVLMLRRREKDFMLRSDMSYVEKFDKDIKKFHDHLRASKHSQDTQEVIHKHMEQYQKDFLALAEGFQRMGLTSNDGLRGEMRNAVHKTETILEELQHDMEVIVTDKVQRTKLISTSASALVIGLIFLLILAVRHSITKPVTKLARLMEQASHDNDMTLRANIDNHDEIGIMAAAFNKMIESFHNMMKQVLNSSDQLSSAAEQLSAITTQTSQGVMKQMSESDQVATAMNEMAATVQEVAKHANDAAEASQIANEESQQSHQVVDSNTTVIRQLAGAVEQTSEIINQLSKDSENIGTFLSVIHDIAEQTNLLALNAAIEAARAGEQGRGFAVVADEVRNLAQRSQSSTGEIEEIVLRLQHTAGTAVEAMQSGKEQALNSVQYAESVSKSLETIAGAIDSINQMNSQIATAAEEQTAVADNINRSIHSISQVASETTEAARQTTDTSDALAKLAVELNQMIARFKL